MRKHRANRPNRKIAILDFETDPFDNIDQTEVYPFLAVLYTDDGPPKVMWHGDWHRLMEAVYDAIADLPDRYIIYAHNGGRFDYMFMLHLLRGAVTFKGRGIMSARIGKHELRDSFHIIPEALKNANRKDVFDYTKLKKNVRDKHREQIIEYCISDCRYTYEVVAAFVEKFGTPLTIGQAAFKEIKREYPQIEHIDEKFDAYLRTYFMGGRCECIKPGIHRGNFKLYDVNSMYPYVMAEYQHPISKSYFVGNNVTDRTAFLTISCRNERALVGRQEDGSLSANDKSGIFHTTIHEYNTALRLGLISDVSIIRTIDFDNFTDFSRFIVPRYNKRAEVKTLIQTCADDKELQGLKYDYLFLKLFLVNSYGKFAQDPRRFKEYYVTDHGKRPPPEHDHYGDFPLHEGATHDIWCVGSQEFRYNNVATAASITGAARAVLMEAIANARNPLYCDTDSLICEGLSNTTLDKFALGAWDCEAEISEFVGAGKKLYGYEKTNGEKIIRSKGVQNLAWDELTAIVGGDTLTKVQVAPTIRKDGIQTYLTRQLRRTAS